MPARRLSGLQKDVLALYRSLLREAVRKDRKAAAGIDMATRQPVAQLLVATSSSAYARRQFRAEAAAVRRSDFKTIEYKLRKGRKQLELLRMPGVDVVARASYGGPSGR